MDPRRSQRVSEALRDELSELISYELSDPRVFGIVVTEVLVSPDGRKAQVRVAGEGDSASQKAALAALEGARGFLRHELGQRLTVFRVPDLHFEADKSPQLSEKLQFLLRRIRKGRPRDAQEEPVE